MKNFIHVLVLLIVFLFTSCSLENEEYTIDKKEISAAKNSYKVLEITHNGKIEIADLQWLKTELNVQQTISVDKGKTIWIMYNSQSIRELKDLLLFSDEVLRVKLLENATQENHFLKNDDTVGDGDTDSDIEEKNDDTVGDGDTDSDIEEKDGGTIGEGETDIEETIN